MRTIALISILIFFVLQYVYWLGPSGYTSILHLGQKVGKQESINLALREQNRLLISEVDAFKNQRLQAVEARARTDLGMVTESEVFYFVDVATLGKKLLTPKSQGSRYKARSDTQNHLNR